MAAKADVDDITCHIAESAFGGIDDDEIVYDDAREVGSYRRYWSSNVVSITA